MEDGVAGTWRLPCHFGTTQLTALPSAPTPLLAGPQVHICGVSPLA